MKVMPLRYSSNVAASVEFYQALGLEVGASSRPGVWVEMPADSGMLAVHEAGDRNAGQCELAFETEEPLEAVVTRIRDAGFLTGPVIDENFGQSLRVRDPDDIWVQINRYDRDLYT